MVPPDLRARDAVQVALGEEGSVHDVWAMVDGDYQLWISYKCPNAVSPRLEERGRVSMRALYIWCVFQSPLLILSEFRLRRLL